jgi:hypothetical protein
VYPESLPVLGGREAETDLRSAGCQGHWDEVALVDLGAVRTDGVYFILRVAAPDVAAAWSAAGRDRPNTHYLANPDTELALHPDESAFNPKDQVATTALGHWPIYAQTELQCSACELELGDRTLLTWR